MGYMGDPRFEVNLLFIRKDIYFFYGQVNLLTCQ